MGGKFKSFSRKAPASLRKDALYKVAKQAAALFAWAALLFFDKVNGLLRQVVERALARALARTLARALARALARTRAMAN